MIFSSNQKKEENDQMALHTLSFSIVIQWNFKCSNRLGTITTVGTMKISSSQG